MRVMLFHYPQPQSSITYYKKLDDEERKTTEAQNRKIHRINAIMSWNYASHKQQSDDDRQQTLIQLKSFMFKESCHAVNVFFVMFF